MLKQSIAANAKKRANFTVILCLSNYYLLILLFVYCAMKLLNKYMFNCVLV